MPKLTTLVTTSRNVSRGMTDDGWQYIDPIHISLWREANSILNYKAFRKDGFDAEVSVDWSPVISRLEHDLDIMKRIFPADGSKASPEAANDFIFTNISLQFSTKLNKNINIKYRSFHCFFIEYFLYDFFIIMNFSSPSSCNLYNCKIRHDEKYSSNIDLSNNGFEISLIESMSGNWPPIFQIPLRDSLEWYNSIKSEQKMTASNNIEKALLAIMHVCKTDISPMSIIWIFYILETLFDTKAGENLRSLIERISMLLGPSAKDYNKFKRDMRNLYDIRSSIVHGGFDIIHPMHNEQLDESIDDTNMKIIRAFDFGFRIITASIQEVCRRKWTRMQFTQILSGT